MIELKNLSYRYKTLEDRESGVSNIDLHIKEGECVVLCGKSGCGKTTLTRLINGLIPHFYEDGDMEGSVFVAGKDLGKQPLSKIAEMVGSVFQNPRTQFFNVDTTSEMAFGCENLGMEVGEIRRRINDACEKFDLESLLDRSIFELSGGEKQRIACASVYAAMPEVFVLDEPSGNLDAKSVGILRETIERLKALGKTVVVAEHRLHYLTGLADRYVLMDCGRIERDISAGEFSHMSSKEISILGLRSRDLKDIRIRNGSEEKTRTASRGSKLKAENLVCRYDNYTALDVPALTLTRGEIVAVIGDNGAGKSTFAACLAGLTKHGGHVSVEDEKLKVKTRLAKSFMVMQDVNHQLFTESVLDELTLNLPDETQEKACDLLNALELAEYRDIHPMALSGGQKQRVAIASALCAGKEILIFDEPTSGLDHDGMRRISKLIRSSADETFLTLVITHDIELIASCCTSVLHFSEGKIAAQYPLDEKGLVRTKEFFIKRTKERSDFMNNEIKKAPKTGWARLLELAATKKALIICSVILAALASVVSFLPYLAIYYIITEVLSVYPDYSLLDVTTVMNYGWLAMGGFIGNILLYFFSLMCSHLAAFGTLYELKVNFASHMAKVPLGFHVMVGSGKLRKIMDENIEKVEGFIAHQVPDIVAAIVAPVVMIVILMSVEWRFGLAALAAIIIALIIQIRAYGRDGTREMMRQYQRTIEDMNNASVEYIRGISVVKAFRQTVYSFRRLHETIKAYTKMVIPYTLGWENFMSAFSTIINNVYLFILPVAIIMGMGTSDFMGYAGNLIFYLVFVPSVATIMMKVMYVTTNGMQIIDGVEAMDAYLSTPALKQPKFEKQAESYDISFDDVRFSYEESGDNVALNGVSFTAKQGEITAVVGPSGGGKTTIAHLIPRFFDVESGSIRLGGIDIREMTSSYLMDNVSFVFQDVFLFKQSVKENIRMGKPGATDAEIIEAAKAAQCHEFILSLPRGYDTVINTKGIHLSGGEKQRIAIARAIIKDSPVVVLDEATAFSDPENEYLIQQAFERLMKEKTVVMIAHRLSTVRSANKIVVIENGQVAQEGIHDELANEPGRYQTMWETYMQTASWSMSGGKEERTSA